jgi:hypothetical protein
MVSSQEPLSRHPQPPERVVPQRVHASLRVEGTRERTSGRSREASRRVGIYITRGAGRREKRKRKRTPGNESP